MGAWGYKALESDEGLDVVDFVEDYISSKYPDTSQIELNLSELITAMKEDGFFGETFDDVEFFYDHSAMALAELYLMFKEDGQLKYEDDEDETKNLKKRVRAFTGDKGAYDFLLRYLMDIKNEKPDKDGEREIVEIWKDSKSFDKWMENLESLIDRLNDKN